MYVLTIVMMFTPRHDDFPVCFQGALRASR